MSATRILLSLTLLLACAVPALAEEVQWKQIIGIIQAGNVVGSGTTAVPGGGQPWSTTRGEAEVNLQTGEVHFQVRGLVLAGGNGIGTSGGIAQVRGTLVCDTNGSAGGGNSTLVDTPPVAFSPQGDAKFNGVVNNGVLPAVCLSEPDIAFLIRIVPAGRWIANGAVRKP